MRTVFLTLWYSGKSDLLLHIAQLMFMFFEAGRRDSSSYPVTEGWNDTVDDDLRIIVVLRWNVSLASVIRNNVWASVLRWPKPSRRAAVLRTRLVAYFSVIRQSRSLVLIPYTINA